MGLLVRRKQYVTKKQKKKSKHQLDKAWPILEIEMYLSFNPEMNNEVIRASTKVQSGYKSPLEN